MTTLTYREREIIKLRYGIGDGYTYTLEEVGRIFKVTRERVRQVHFREDVRDGKMSFDYRLRPGPVGSGNALRLMRSVGLNVPLD